MMHQDSLKASVSQSVENLLYSKFLKFQSNLMQRVRVDLKTFLGLVMPNQCCHVVTKLMLGWFVGGIFGQETLSLNDAYIYYYCTI